jgi:acetolactate synthase-1/2/3 large subunit
MHFVAALDRIPGMRCVLGLFEGVVTGAADGYARMTDKPAATLLHCGPGLANGLANLHNARRANTPILNIVGDQATYHRTLDPPLTADTEGWARPVSRWVRTSTQAAFVGEDAAAAVRASLESPGGIASLILPSDVCWNEGASVGPPRAVPVAPPVDSHAIEVAAKILRSGEPTALVVGGKALRAAQLEVATRIAAATGARLFAPTHNARIERGAGRYPITRLPYSIEQAVKLLSGVAHVILIGARRPVTFFAYPNKPGVPEPEGSTVHVLARAEHDLADALARLAEHVGADRAKVSTSVREKMEPATGSVTARAVGQMLTALLPEQSVVVDESVSFGRDIYPTTHTAAPHDWLLVTGGAIGAGIPMATGAALGAPNRRIVNLQADGSALYTSQGLWTQAREKLDVTTVILSNRKYAILLGEYANVGAKPGRVATDMMSLGNPNLSWTELAAGYGVEAARAETMERCADLLAFSFSRAGPFLIELVIP